MPRGRAAAAPEQAAKARPITTRCAPVYPQETPYASIIWRPDLHKYSGFRMFPTDSLNLGSTWALVPPVPGVFISLIEVRSTCPRRGKAAGSGPEVPTVPAAAAGLLGLIMQDCSWLVLS